MVEASRAELETHVILAKVTGFSSKLEVKFQGTDALLAVLKESKKPRINIRFSDKLDACKKITFVDTKLAPEIIGFYEMRNTVHLGASMKKSIGIAVADARRGFRRINGFCEKPYASASGEINIL